MKFAFIRDHQGEFPVDLLCGVLGVSRSGYYAWRVPALPAQRPRPVASGWSNRSKRPTASPARPTARHALHRELQAQGVACCENTVAKLMHAHGIRSKVQRRFVVRTTDSRHDRPVAENLLAREFYPDRPKHRLGRRHHVHPDRRGLALPGGRD